MEKVKFNDSFLEHQRPLFGYTGKVQERWDLMTFPFNTKGDLSVTLKILLSIGKLAFLMTFHWNIKGHLSVKLDRYRKDDIY